MDGPTFPFGKYQGKTVDFVRETDPQYIDWLLGQSWFSERNPVIHQHIINMGSEQEETPEHNRLQALFLDESYRSAVASAAGIEMKLRTFPVNQHEWWKAGKEGGEEIKAVESIERPFVGDPTFEPIDVAYFGWTKGEVWRDQRHCDRGYNIGVEIKPSLGDDYPAVIRRIKRQKSRFYWIVFAEKFTASGVTKEQLEAIFEASSIKVVWKSDVDELLEI